MLALAYAFALVFALVLPFSPGAFVWPIVLLAIVLYWRRLWSTSREEGRERPKPSLIRIAAVAMIASAVVSVARQLDPTAQLPSVDVYLSPVKGDLPVSALPATIAPVRSDGVIRGILIMASEDSVAVGNPKQGAIGTYPRSRVIAMSVGRPLVPRTPPASLMSLLLFEDAWALTPLKLWCGGDDYALTHLGDACQGRPVVERGSLRADGRVLRDLRITCPDEAQSSCRGFVKVQAAEDRRDGRKARTGGPRPGSTSRCRRAGPSGFRCLSTRSGGASSSASGGRSMSPCACSWLATPSERRSSSTTASADTAGC